MAAVMLVNMAVLVAVHRMYVLAALHLQIV
jgi:hypothetical protein